jgi:general secretion pathway protein G
MQRVKEQDLRRALHEIRAGIDAYKKASDEGRIRREVNATGYPKDLALLEEGVVDQRDPKGNKMYFLRRVPPDPFYPDPDAKPADTWGKRSYASEPNDPHEGDDVFDVYTMSNANGLNGVPYRKW